MYSIDSPFLNLQQSSIDWLYRYEPILDFLVVHELLDADILDYGSALDMYRAILFLEMA